MTRYSDSDHVVSQGTLRHGSARIDYYTTTPAPSQWIAVGVLFCSYPDARAMNCRRLLVGNGASEKSAIADLNRQFSASIAQLEAAEASRRKSEQATSRSRAPRPHIHRQSQHASSSRTVD